MQIYRLRSPDGTDEVEFLDGFEAEIDRLEARGWKRIYDLPAPKQKRVKDAPDSGEIQRPPDTVE